MKILPLVPLGKRSYPALNVNITGQGITHKRRKLNEAGSYCSMGRRACSRTTIGFCSGGQLLMRGEDGNYVPAINNSWAQWVSSNAGA